MTKFELDLLRVFAENGDGEDYFDEVSILLQLRQKGYFQNVNDDMTLDEAIIMYEKLLYKGSE